MLKIFTRTRKPVQLELWPITDVEKNINANCKRIAELNRIMDTWKVRPDHTNQLNLFGVGPYEMWTIMVDRESK